jgi:group I intron endonuclease
MVCSIYKIINNINNKLYIGQTWNSIESRFFDHKKPSSKNCIKLRRAFNKYGSNNFTIILIECCDDQIQADALEAFYIRRYNSIENGYNIQPGGSHGKHSEETKKKIGDAHRGKIMSEDSKKKISVATSGENHHHYGIPTWNKGISPNEETKDKLSKVQRKLTDEQVMDILNDDRSLSEIANEYNLGKTTISRIKHGISRYSKQLIQKMKE